MSQQHKACRLSEIESNQGIPFSHAAPAVGHHCPMHTALATLQGISGVSTLVVGMPECGFYSRYVMETPKGPDGELHYTYVLDANEVVFGCRDGLLKALEEMERDGADAIAVTMTCVPALIGEDIQEITESFGTGHRARAAAMDLAHYKRNGYEAGYYETYLALAEFCDASKKENMVFLLGGAQSQEGRELCEWLYTGSSSYDIVTIEDVFKLSQFTKISSSCLNIVTNIHFLPLAKRLEEVYDIPYVFLGESYGRDGIQEAYKKIGTALLLRETPVFTHSQEAAKLEARVRERLEGSRFLLTANIPDALILTEYLCSLSMTPCFLHLEEYQQWMKEWKKKILSHGSNPLTAFLVKDSIAEDGFKEIGFEKPGSYRFVIGKEIGEEIGCLKAGRSFLPPLIGYERTFALLKLLDGLLREENTYAAL